MDILIERDYDAMSRLAARIIAAEVRRKPEAVLGFATGSTPLGTYAELARMHREEGLDFSGITTFNLDEYVGLASDHEQSYSRFMWDNLFSKVNVERERVHIPRGDAPDLARHCEDYERMIREAGGVDLQLLGIGSDGHVGFNEPGSSLGGRTRVVALARETIRDNSRFFAGADDVPRFAVTMGVGTILGARRCLLVASGAGKAEACALFMEGPVTSAVTASALQLHPDATVVLDEAAAANLERLEHYRALRASPAAPPEWRDG